MNRIVTVLLEDFELSIVNEIGPMKARRYEKKDTFYGNTPRDGRLVHTLSYGAELAVCKHLNAFPDLRVNVWHPNYDLVYKGWTVDVKNTDNPNGTLICTRKRASDHADIFVLTRSQGITTYHLVGWCHWHILLDPANLQNMTKDKVPTYVLGADQLRDMVELRRLLRKGALQVNAQQVKRTTL